MGSGIRSYSQIPRCVVHSSFARSIMLTARYKASSASVFTPYFSRPGYVLISAQLTQLYTTDTKALNHFLTNSYIYQKAELSRYFLSRIVGPGALFLLFIFSTHSIHLPRGSCRRGRCSQTAGRENDGSPEYLIGH
jgi:hypothetical protein